MAGSTSLPIQTYMGRLQSYASDHPSIMRTKFGDRDLSSRFAPVFLQEDADPKSHPP